MNILDPYGFVYITTNKINGKRYIGKRSFSGNWKNYLGSGVAFKRAVTKYGRDNFYRNIIHVCYSKEELNDMEILYIDLFKANISKDYYNLKTGGDSGDWRGSKTEEELLDIRRRISEMSKGERNGHYGKKHSDEQKLKWSLSRKGIHSGNKNPNYGNGDKIKGLKNPKSVPLIVKIKSTGENIKFECITDAYKYLKKLGLINSERIKVKTASIGYTMFSNMIKENLEFKNIEVYLIDK